MQFIDGKWTTAGGNEFCSTNPANGHTLWTGQAAVTEDVDVAVRSARGALASWRRLSLDERTEFLMSFRAQLEEHQTTLARIISEEVGKPLWDAASEVRAMIGKIAVSLSALKDRRSDSEVLFPDGTGTTRYKPHGVMAVYGPFNFPGHIANGQIVPALAAGNTIVFKPSELTPKVAEETVKLWERAGLPPGVLNLIQGGRETGAALAQHTDVNGILFTGSLRTGVALRKALAEQPEKILVLELGGNNPLVVHQLADIEAAVYWTLQSAFITGGQRCTCARRLIITDESRDFLPRLIEATKQIRIAPPDADPAPFFGPLINAQAVQHMLRSQQELLNAGGESLVMARELDLGDAYVSPGVVDITNCLTTNDQEIFGPLLQVVRVSSLEHAIQQANQTQYGLVAALFTTNRADFDTFYDRVDAGLINWNRPTTGASGQLPFGGVGRSGNHRPAGSFAVDFCNIPIATLETSSLQLPDHLSPGLNLS